MGTHCPALSQTSWSTLLVVTLGVACIIMTLIIVALLVGKGIPKEDVYLGHTSSGKDVSRDADTILNKTDFLKV